MDLMTILLLVIFAFFIFTMFRRNRKQQAQQAEMRSKFVPGVEVMTSFGLYGRILEVDEAENKVLLELSPGTTATVHRQAVSKIVEPSVPVAEGDAEGALDPADAATDHGSEAPHGGAAASPESQLHETPEQSLKRLEGEGK